MRSDVYGRTICLQFYFQALVRGVFVVVTLPLLCRYVSGLSDRAAICAKPFVLIRSCCHCSHRRLGSYHFWRHRRLGCSAYQHRRFDYQQCGYRSRWVHSRCHRGERSAISWAPAYGQQGAPTPRIVLFHLKLKSALRAINSKSISSINSPTGQC